MYLSVVKIVCLPPKPELIIYEKKRKKREQMSKKKGDKKIYEYTNKTNMRKMLRLILVKDTWSIYYQIFFFLWFYKNDFCLRVQLWLRMEFPKRVCREASLWLVEVKKSSVIRFKFRSESNARELAAEKRFKFRVSRVQLERSCDYWLQKRHGRNRTRLFVSRFRFHASNLNAPYRQPGSILTYSDWIWK